MLEKNSFLQNEPLHMSNNSQNHGVGSTDHFFLLTSAGRELLPIFTQSS